MKKLAGWLVLALCAGSAQARVVVDTAGFPATPAETLDAGASDCLARANTLGREQDAEFIRVTFDAGLDAAPAEAPVGSQPVAMVYKGSAVYQAKPGSERQQFICLHNGEPGGVVFFDYLPVSIELPDITRYNQYETWRCRRQGEFLVTYNSVRDQIYLRHAGRDQALRHAVSASGSRYDNAELAWWGKGREASLIARDGESERVLDSCHLESVTQP